MERLFSLVRRTDDPQSSVFFVIPNTIFLSGNLLLYIIPSFLSLFVLFCLYSFLPFSCCVFPFIFVCIARAFIRSVVFCHAECLVAEELFIYFLQLYVLIFDLQFLLPQVTTAVTSQNFSHGVVKSKLNLWNAFCCSVTRTFTRNISVKMKICGTVIVRVGLWGRETSCLALSEDGLVHRMFIASLGTAIIRVETCSWEISVNKCGLQQTVSGVWWCEKVLWNRLRMCENKVLREIFWFKNDRVVEEIT